MRGNFLTSCKPVSCSGRSLHRGVTKWDDTFSTVVFVKWNIICSIFSRYYLPATSYAHLNLVVTIAEIIFDAVHKLLNSLRYVPYSIHKSLGIFMNVYFCVGRDSKCSSHGLWRCYSLSIISNVTTWQFDVLLKFKKWEYPVSQNRHTCG
jgi:hypothetical protein